MDMTSEERMTRPAATEPRFFHTFNCKEVMNQSGDTVWCARRKPNENVSWNEAAQLGSGSLETADRFQPSRDHA